MKDAPIGGKEPPQPITPLPPILPCTENVAYLRWVHSVLLVVGCAAGATWGLKLESRMDAARASDERLSERVAELERTVGRGILPLTEERLTRLAVRFEQVTDDHATMRERIESVSAAVERLNLFKAECALAAERAKNNGPRRR
jgi:hypothetical protein